MGLPLGLFHLYKWRGYPPEASKKASHIAPAIELLSSLPSDLTVLTRTEKKKRNRGMKPWCCFRKLGNSAKQVAKYGSNVIKTCKIWQNVVKKNVKKDMAKYGMVKMW